MPMDGYRRIGGTGRWTVLHARVTESTNRDARGSRAGLVFSAGFQTAGRGRLDHRWLSRPDENLAMSAVVDASGLAPEHVATAPLVAGVSAVETARSFGADASLKWPNDVLVRTRKLAGILCERDGDSVIVGIGVNVLQTEFPPGIASRATSLAALLPRAPSVAEVRDELLRRMDADFALWRERGFAALLPRVRAADALAGLEVEVMRTDDDAEPARGVCGGVAEDGSLLVAGERIYAGEAHVVRSRAIGDSGWTTRCTPSCS